jgi:Protein of unknown function (DUF664)
VRRTSDATPPSKTARWSPLTAPCGRPTWRHGRPSARRAGTASAARSLSDTGLTGMGEPCSLRWIYVHMIEEYARHNGHADLIRELTDGAVGW